MKGCHFRRAADMLSNFAGGTAVSKVAIEDVVIWFKHISDPQLRNQLRSLAEDVTLYLAADGIVGRWQRMKNGVIPTEGIKPDGAMKAIWNEWFRTRKGNQIEISIVVLAEDFVASGSLMFSEWLTPEDEEAYGGLKPVATA